MSLPEFQLSKADLVTVKSTLGPKGMDKILQSASTGEIMVTNDGATILKSIALDNAGELISSNLLVSPYGSGAWSLELFQESVEKKSPEGF